MNLRDFAAELSARTEGEAVVVGDEVSLVVAASSYLGAMRVLRDEFEFAQLMDLCGVDYSDYKNGRHGLFPADAFLSNEKSGPHPETPLRFAVVCHLLSLAQNRRLRVRVYCPDNDHPALDSICAIWPAANWFEREAFDLFGVLFRGHPDLRRILTDYGFAGHPFRKDFPVSGKVEMRYDPRQKRVIYEPVSIPPREIVPRVVRDEDYGREDAAAAPPPANG